MRSIRAAAPLIVNVAIGLALRLALPYTLADSGERYRYYAMSHFFPLPGCPSFHCFRVLPPQLTALLPLEPADAFVAIGLLFQILAGVMVWLIAERLHGSTRVAAFATGLYWVTWAPIQALGDPLLITDPVAAFWSLSAIYLLLDERFAAALAVLVTGTTVKESVLLVPVIYAAYAVLAAAPARRRTIWLAVLIGAPIAAWLLLRITLSSRFGYVTYEDESYIRQTYFFGLWLPNLGEFPKNLLIASLYIFGSCGAAWLLGPIGLRHASRQQRALTIAALPAMLFLALYQVPDRALASFPYATLIPAALLLSRVPAPLGVALLVTNAAFTIRMNTAVTWLPPMPIALATLALLAAAAVVLDRRRPAGSPEADVREPRPLAGLLATVAIALSIGAVSLHAWRAVAAKQVLPWPDRAAPLLVDDESGTPSLALSPDGTSVVFVASDGGIRSARQLWTRGIRVAASVPLRGTAGASAPFWSPDGRRVGFFAGGQLKTIDVGTGDVIDLAPAPMGHGGAWSAGGVIIFAPDRAGGLSQVAAAGGPVTPATEIDPAHRGASHRWPAFFPDGRHFVFAAREGSGEESALCVAELGSRSFVRLSEDPDHAQRGSPLYAGPGFLLFGSADALWMQPFDAARRQPFGHAYRIAAAAYDPVTMHGAFTASGATAVVAGPRGQPISIVVGWPSGPTHY